MALNNSSDEIDLLKLITDGYRTIRKNLMLLTVCAIVAGFLGVAATFFTKNKYSSSMMIATDLLSANEAHFIFNELDRTDSVPGLTRKEFREIKTLSFSVEEKTGDNNVYLKVTAEVKDSKLYPILEHVIITYLNQTNSVVRSREDQKILYGEMIKKIDQEIAGMEDVKKQTDSKSLAAFISPADLYTKTVDLYQRRTELEIRLKRIESIHLVKGFGSLIKDTKLSKPMAGLIGLIAGVIMAFALIFINFLSTYIKNHPEHSL